MASTFFILKAGIAPPELASYPDAVKLMFWGWITELGLKRKDWELARGLNAKGEPLGGVAQATRKHRKSEMTPSGKGDPRAPYLMPGRGLSRTRSLLAGKAHTTYAEFFWRYDAHTGDQFGRVLAWHAARGEAYDVVGLSPAGIQVVAREARKRWRQWLASSPGLPVPAAAWRDQQRPAAAQGPVGTTNLTHATFGIGSTKAQAQKAIDEGRSSGFMTIDQWTRYFRQRRAAIPTAQAPSVQRGSSNVLLQHVHAQPPSAARSSRKMEAAINSLLASLNANLTVTQVEAVLGEMFEPALAEAVRRGLVVLAIDNSGKPVLKVVR